ncbi:ABC transporter ATP-binding protein [Zavarzinia compransoris]|uniref:ABC transporter n=1 Tax=Zavarzinia compransoris TaxID=1264899 RepID=A0A317E5K2_9PROT|nr:ABC transporter ATP-binding protein [Zavarzinia compransoris]PWR22299.1 ABC transporter [Zavarzinia compransoris]TDP46937.1 NitT/TauT family transport system ATP-binding protein [Zavarzinia compransoris]
MAPLIDSPVIDISDLSIVLGGNTILEGFNLRVEKGEFVAVVGASGVGKSTLLRIIADLIPAAKGTAKVTTAPAADRRPYAMVFQDARLLPWRRVSRNVEFGAEGLAIGRAERHARAAQALALVGLGDHGARYPHQLSGGQRQRVAIARALAVAPEILLMDEPFGALDAITRAGLQDELVRLWQETGKTIIFVTHDIDEAVYLADRVILLGGKPGRIQSEHRVLTPRPRARDHVEAQSLAAEIRDNLQNAVYDGAGI